MTLRCRHHPDAPVSAIKPSGPIQCHACGAIAIDDPFAPAPKAKLCHAEGCEVVVPDKAEEPTCPAHSKHHWSRTPPTEPGLFWFLADYFDARTVPVIVRKHADTGRLRVFAAYAALFPKRGPMKSWWLDRKDLSGYWAKAIPPVLPDDMRHL